MSDEVPFGKYKGRPVEDMLADTEYMVWLEAQPWFRERFSHLLRQRDADAASRTPVHNRLQALFLEPRYCMAALAGLDPAYFPKAISLAAKQRIDCLDEASKQRNAPEQHAWESDERHMVALANWQAREDEYAAVIEDLKARPEKPSHKVAIDFEARGADVVFRIETSWWTVIPPSHDYIGRDQKAILSKTSAELHDGFYGGRTVRLEIKPTVADDYPAVLRQMRRHETNTLFVDRYCGEGVSEAQFVAIFKASGISVIFKRDVDDALDAIPA